MKRTIKKAIVISLALLLLVSCTALPKPEPAEQPETTVATTDKEVTESEALEPDNQPETEEFTFNINETVDISLKNTTPDELAFTSYNVRGAVDFKNDVVYPDVYKGSSIYFLDHGLYEELPNCVAKAWHYDFATNEAKELFSYTYRTYEAVLVELNGYAFAAPCDLDESGALIMTLLCYNLEKDEPQILEQFEATIPAVDIKVLGDDVLIFVYRKINGSSVDTIYRYSTVTNEFSIYYEDFTDEWSNLAFTSKNIRTIDTSGDKVYILKYQSIDYKMTYTLEIRDAAGSVIKEYDISAFDEIIKSDSRIKGYYVQEFWCLNDYLLFQMYYDGDYPTQYNIWKYRLCKIVGDEIIDIGIDEYKPLKASPSVSEVGEYWLLRTERTDISMLLLDTVNHELTPVKCSTEPIMTKFFCTVCNEKGQVLTVGESKSLNSRYLFSFDLRDIIGK